MSGRPESLPCISFFSSYMHTKHGSYCLYSSTDSTDITESTECTTDSLARSMYHTRNGTRFHMKRNIRIPMKLSGVPCLRLRGEMVTSAVVAQGAEQRVQVSSMQVKQDGCTHGKGVAVLAVVVSILLADSVRSFVMPTPTSWTSMSTAHRHVASSCCRQGRHYVSIPV